MADRLRVTLETGPKGKKVVAVAPGWPGLARGAATEQAAVERLLSYRPRYAKVAKLAGMSAAFAAAVARHFRCDEERVQDIKVAISEACSNAVKAHRTLGVAEPISLVVKPVGDILWYEISDQGGGFDQQRKGGSPIEGGELFEGGIGLMLIRSLFPETEILGNPRGGTTLRFGVPTNPSS